MANNCHSQEITARKESHTSHDQFKSAKLLRKPLVQKPTQKTAQRRRKIKPEENPTLQVFRLTRYRSSSSYYFLTQIFLPQSTVQTVPPLCCVPSSSFRSWRWGGGAREVMIVTCIEPPLSAKTRQQPPLQKMWHLPKRRPGTVIAWAIRKLAKSRRKLSKARNYP